MMMPLTNTLGPLGRALQRGLTFLLRDDFITPQAAPLTSPRTCEPGPGTLVVVDTGNKLSIDTGRLVFNAAVPLASYDPRAFSGESYSRAVGLMMSGVYSDPVGSRVVCGLGTTNQVGSEHGFLQQGPLTLRLYVGGLDVNVGDFTTANTDYRWAIVLRQTGAFYLFKGGIFSGWVLLWVDAARTSSPLYLVVGTSGTIANLAKADNLAVTNLLFPWSASYGIATQRLAGARQAGDAFTHEADCVLEWVITSLPTIAVPELSFRYQDANNRWAITWYSDGRLALYEIVAGVYTVRAITAAGAVANNSRVVIIADGGTIRGYSNNILRWTYSNASNFQALTAGTVYYLPVQAGTISDIISWPRTLSGAALAALDAAT